MYRGDIRLGDTIDIKFVTTAVATGAPTTLSGTPVISAYVGNGTTEITAGITLTADFDARTGLNNVRVVASSGNGFATATNVQLVITTGTVGGTSVVGYVVAEFSIEARSAVMPTTAARTLDISATGEAGVDWANVGSPTTSVNLSATTVNLTNTATTVTNQLTAAAIATGVWQDTTAGDFTTALSIGKTIVNGVALGTGLTINAYTGNTVQTGDSFARIGLAGAGLTNIDLPNQTMDITGNLSGSVGSVTAGVTLAASAVQAIWDALTSALTTVGSIGKLIVDNLNATVSSRGSQTSVDDLPTNAELATALGTADDAVLAQVALVKAKTDLIPAVPASTGDAMALTAGERTTLAGVVGTTVQTEAYRADGAAGSLAQMLYETIGHLGESSIASTTKTIKKVDGTTAAATFTLDDATTPTSITRAT